MYFLMKVWGSCSVWSRSAIATYAITNPSSVTTYECRPADHRSPGHQAEFWPSTPFGRPRNPVDERREYPAGSCAADAPGTSHSCAPTVGHSLTRHPGRQCRDSPRKSYKATCLCQDLPPAWLAKGDPAEN